MMDWLLYALIGVVTGLLSGLLGLGGGLIVVPSLFILFASQGMAHEKLMHMAISTSLMTIIVTSLASTLSHYRLQTINGEILRRLSPMLVLGAITGAYISLWLSTSVLQYFFAIYALFVAVTMWSSKPIKTHEHFLNQAVIFPVGGFIGIISALVGIGGGSLTVPYLLMAKQPIQHAIGTSAACGLPISIAAVMGFIIFEQGDDIGAIINWTAFIGITSTSIIFAGVGAKLTQKLPVNKLKRLFSLVLFTVALSLIL